MTVIVTVKYLANETISNQIRERLERELKSHDGDCRISVLGSAENDTWEVKLADLDGTGRHVKKLDANATADQVVEEAIRMVADFKAL